MLLTCLDSDIWLICCRGIFKQLCIRQCHCTASQAFFLELCAPVLFSLLQGQPGASPFDFDESKIFHKFDLFTKRCKKLISMFGTIHQFSSLAQYTHLDGLDQMIKNFYNIVDDIKRKPYDLLDFYRTQFDRDFLEFNVNIHDLELALQGFINASFKQISSTEHSLNLLRQFQVILVRDSLKVM